MSYLLRQALGLESGVLDEPVNTEVTETDYVRSQHELEVAIDATDKTIADINTVSSYTDFISKSDIENNQIAVEAIYIGLEHILNKHQITTTEYFPSLESWDTRGSYNKQISLEKLDKILDGLKTGAKNMWDYLVKKFNEFVTTTRIFIAKHVIGRAEKLRRTFSKKFVEVGHLQINGLLCAAYISKDDITEERIKDFFNALKMDFINDDTDICERGYNSANWTLQKDTTFTGKCAGVYVTFTKNEDIVDVTSRIITEVPEELKPKIMSDLNGLKHRKYVYTLESDKLNKIIGNLSIRLQQFLTYDCEMLKVGRHNNGCPDKVKMGNVYAKYCNQVVSSLTSAINHLLVFISDEHEIRYAKETLDKAKDEKYKV